MGHLGRQIAHYARIVAVVVRRQALYQQNASKLVHLRDRNHLRGLDASAVFAPRDRQRQIALGDGAHEAGAVAHVQGVFCVERANFWRNCNDAVLEIRTRYRTCCGSSHGTPASVRSASGSLPAQILTRTSPAFEILEELRMTPNSINDFQTTTLDEVYGSITRT